MTRPFLFLDIRTSTPFSRCSPLSKGRACATLLRRLHFFWWDHLDLWVVVLPWKEFYTYDAQDQAE
jgi:hypothetical protein